MFLKFKSHGELVEILELQNLHDPFQKTVLGKFHAGEEMQDPEEFSKSELVFPSGEALPQCWQDPDYNRKIHQQDRAVV